MTAIYMTADRIGLESGGGKVTQQELLALQGMGLPTVPVTIDHARPPRNPFQQDEEIYASLGTMGRVWFERNEFPKLAHAYAGCLSRSVTYLKSVGTKVTYTAAAHSVAESKLEHEKLGLPFQYDHLTDPLLWQGYLKGYLEADVLIVPSRHSEKVMREYGRKDPIRVIPHGVDIPGQEIRPLPKKFVVGVLGAVTGPDKGLIYLLQAWKSLRYREAVLRIAGSASTTSYCQQLIQAYGGGNVETVGWVDRIEDFYNGISLLVQPSVSEGFGLEVLEAMAYGRPVLCSVGAGASDVLPASYVFPPRDVEELAAKIDVVRYIVERPSQVYLQAWRSMASKCTWEKVRAMYQEVWREL